MISTKVTTELKCRAEHPAVRKGIRRFEGRTHGVRIIRVPFRCEPTGRILDDLEEVPLHRIGVICPSSDCKKVTEYQVVPRKEPG